MDWPACFQAVDPEGVAASDPVGYLKLEGWEVDELFNIQRHVSFLVTQLPVMLGRGAPSSATDAPKLQITTSTKVSRDHALLDWDEDAGCYKLNVHGKNTVLVDSECWPGCCSSHCQAGGKPLSSTFFFELALWCIFFSSLRVPPHHHDHRHTRAIACAPAYSH